MYKVILTRQVLKDAENMERVGLKRKAVGIISIIRQNPFQNPPSYEKLQRYKNTYSRRINIQHRLIYQVFPNEHNAVNSGGIAYQGIIKVIRMWTHYE
ncbi:MAG: Txe/YoeB family addiction module toxin [Treponema sp.]|jgi:Txe/YoeB family toxin of toxin-antitoxin system|nr:Txe/YoeB family addiction module toxin [Treponema sp.]